MKSWLMSNKRFKLSFSLASSSKIYCGTQKANIIIATTPCKEQKEFKTYIGFNPLVKGFSLITNHHLFQARALVGQDAILRCQLRIVCFEELVGVLQFLDLKHSNVTSLLVFNLCLHAECHQLDRLLAKGKVALQHTFFS